MMNVFKDDLDKAVEIVGDMITNSLYKEKDVDRERSTIHRELI
jgi:predicted Zn-dependent peptidase